MDLENFPTRETAKDMEDVYAAADSRRLSCPIIMEH